MTTCYAVNDQFTLEHLPKAKDSLMANLYNSSAFEDLEPLIVKYKFDNKEECEAMAVQLLPFDHFGNIEMFKEEDGMLLEQASYDGVVPLEWEANN